MNTQRDVYVYTNAMNHCHCAELRKNIEYNEFDDCFPC